MFELHLITNDNKIIVTSEKTSAYAWLILKGNDYLANDKNIKGYNLVKENFIYFTKKR